MNQRIGIVMQNVFCWFAEVTSLHCCIAIFGGGSKVCVWGGGLGVKGKIGVGGLHLKHGPFVQ